jgi:cardiolipin synthase
LGYYIAITLAILVPVFHLLGMVSALRAVMTARTPQGSIAWAISLVTFPYIAVPLYWVFGRSKFHGFVETMRIANVERRRELDEIIRTLHRQRADLPPQRAEEFRVLGHMGLSSWTKGNRLNLLVDGQATFDAIFDAIRGATKYVLVQFFIIHDDSIGTELKDLLLSKSAAGVRIYLLYDEIGSHNLPRSYIADLRAGGIEVRPFNTRQGWKNRFQVNFRNHRKIVVVDGELAFVGGHNVGDEYLGRDPKIGRWRDTHVTIRGPAVQAAQLSFVADWYWASRGAPQAPLKWEPSAVSAANQAVLVLSTGPADADDNCLMMFLEAISGARKRFWVASPYFVPDPALFEAMKLAARRGVDVRVILPENPDHLFVFLAGFDFLGEACRAGIKIFRYKNGFMHQKVFLIDDDVAAVGSANLDARSIRLNFEITILSIDREFASEVESMLKSDLGECRLSDVTDLHRKGYLFRVAVRVARLLSPVL